MVSRRRPTPARVRAGAILTVLLTTGPLAAQTAQGSLTSAMAQVQIVATVPPTAHLSVASRLSAWSPSGAVRDAMATLAVLPNAPYRIVVYRLDDATPAGRETPQRLWVGIPGGELEELHLGTPVVIRRRGGSGGEQVATLSVRTDSSGSPSASPPAVPFRYEIEVEPTL